MPHPDIAIVIPAWNEYENLKRLLPALRDVVEKMGITAETLVVDGGSNDGSRELTEALGAKFVLQDERGYGGALLAGFASATAPYILTMDADLSHPPVFVADLWEHRNGAEVVIASRYVEGGRADMTAFRRLLSGILNFSFARILDLPVKDLSSGFRLYRREALVNLELHARDFDILEEILVRIYLKGWRVCEVPFSYMARDSGSSHARLFKFAVAFLRTLARMRKLRSSGPGPIKSETDLADRSVDLAPPSEQIETPIARAAGRNG